MCARKRIGTVQTFVAVAVAVTVRRHFHSSNQVLFFNISIEGLNGGGSYQKCDVEVMSSMWKKNGAFDRNVHIHLKTGIKVLDY